ncbi:MAG: CHRD domain-containing protein [Planctomycetes bacterium]|nr:CHRD domain-containing protein [Planctomycetota bacterium]
MQTIFNHSRFAVCALALAAGTAAQASITVFNTTLSGGIEVPPNNSMGTGTGEMRYDDVAHTLRILITFSGLTGNTTACHIHSATALPGSGTAGVATPTPTFPGFPGGVTSGSYDNTLNLTLASSYNPAFLTARGGSVAAAESFLINSMRNNTAYLNIHTTFAGGGEIRGFIPAPGAAAVLGLGGLLAVGRRRR